MERIKRRLNTSAMHTMLGYQDTKQTSKLVFIWWPVGWEDNSRQPTQVTSDVQKPHMKWFNIAHEIWPAAAKDRPGWRARLHTSRTLTPTNISQKQNYSAINKYKYRTLSLETEVGYREMGYPQWWLKNAKRDWGVSTRLIPTYIGSARLNCQDTWDDKQD